MVTALYKSINRGLTDITDRSHLATIADVEGRRKKEEGRRKKSMCKCSQSNGFSKD